MNTQGSDRPAAGGTYLVTAAAEREQPAAPLINAKLTMPAVPPDAIARPRLHTLLDAAAAARLALIAAPAGFGKTVAVTHWLSAGPAQVVAWLSLDQSDNDPARFWTYALAALAAAGTRCEPWADQVIQAAGTHPPEDALAPLVNSLAGLDSEVIWVLDDCHLITDPRIHQALAFLISHQPPSLHLVVLTRSDPPFVAARWKASGQWAR